jgi:hypothetical protein
MNPSEDAEMYRLEEDRLRIKHWKRWGPYLAEREWGTLREDYSANGDWWRYFPHDHARSRAYRWGEDGLLGITDREGRLYFALALWNGKDPILKERLFGLTGAEGNHGEDVKECYYYLDSTPTHSYMKALYKYPQTEYPYARLLEESRARSRRDPEFELTDTGIFDENRYFDIEVEYAKRDPNDILIQITVSNRGPEAATLHLLPTLWFRNTWSWACGHEGCWAKPHICTETPALLRSEHATLGKFMLGAGPAPNGQIPTQLFTDNETNYERLFGVANGQRFVKDAFHAAVIQGRADMVNPNGGTKAAFHYLLQVPPDESCRVRLRLSSEAEWPKMETAFGAAGDTAFDAVFAARIAEADAFYATRIPPSLLPEERGVARQAYAGLLWSKQFYHYVIQDWQSGDASGQPVIQRQSGQNREWGHLFNRDVISMPDKWEYPWYASWDLAFQMVPFARIDPSFAKSQMVLLLREGYMHPNGQLPAYEMALSDATPPVHAWACLQIYRMMPPDPSFLIRVFQKLLINFTWWVNRKDPLGRHLFSGGFLGMDNIGVFDRSRPLPTVGLLEQADGTAWMAFYCANMFEIALTLAQEEPAYADTASRFFEHFVVIANAMNTAGGSGLWNEEDGFYYDQLLADGKTTPLTIRSVAGMIPIIAAVSVDADAMNRGLHRRMQWFLNNRPDLARNVALIESPDRGTRYFVSVPGRRKLERMLQHLLDPEAFLSPYGIRSLSRRHAQHPYHFAAGNDWHSIEYAPGESTTDLFGGNSNWRGPVWFPINYLLIQALLRYHDFYGDRFTVECPVGSGTQMTLKAVAAFLTARLTQLFLPDEAGARPCHGDDPRYANDPHWKQLILFYEHFHGETGRGIGASHQTGWTALVASCLEDLARSRSEVL